MIFSKKIFKIVDGQNPSLFAINNNVLNLYIFNKSLRKYDILLNSNRNCVFCKNYNYKKIIQLNQNSLCPCSNCFITKVNTDEI